MAAVVVSTINSKTISRLSRRLSLPVGQVLRLKSTVREINVISGYAWVSHNGQDILLSAGDRTSFAPDRDTPVVSAIGGYPVLLEAWE